MVYFTGFILYFSIFIGTLHMAQRNSRFCRKKRPQCGVNGRGNNGSVYAAKALDNENTACRLICQASTSPQSPSPCSAMLYAADAYIHADGGSLSRDRGINAVFSMITSGEFYRPFGNAQRPLANASVTATECKMQYTSHFSWAYRIF